MTKFDIS